jgi:hypothetical protein
LLPPKLPHRDRRQSASADGSQRLPNHHQEGSPSEQLALYNSPRTSNSSRVATLKADSLGLVLLAAVLAAVLATVLRLPVALPGIQQATSCSSAFESSQHRLVTSPRLLTTPMIFSPFLDSSGNISSFLSSLPARRPESHGRHTSSTKPKWMNPLGRRGTTACWRSSSV